MLFIKKLGICVTLLSMLFACSDYDSVKTTQPISPYQLNVIHYFTEIALGFEYGTKEKTIRKWTSSMRIFVGGQKTNTLLQNELNKTIREINELATDGFSIEVTDDSIQSNCYIFLGSQSEFLEMFPGSAASLGTNYGVFYVWYNHREIHKARIFVDAVRPSPDQQRSTLKEELTQALGLGRDSPEYKNSIFYETPDDGGFSTEYSPMDNDVIRLLYHPQVTNGLDESFLNFVLLNIYQEENHL